MEEWKKIQKTYKIRELIGITGMIMSFVIGAICDWKRPFQVLCKR